MVNDEITFALKTLATGGAIVIKLAGVGRCVLSQTDFAAECFLAEQTLERFFSCVFSHVFLQFVIRAILLAALSTNFRSPFLADVRLSLCCLLLVSRICHRRAIFSSFF